MQHGVGLGLTICKSLLAKMGCNQITVKSYVGAGTVFQFGLPRNQGPDPQRAIRGKSVTAHLRLNVADDLVIRLEKPEDNVIQECHEDDSEQHTPYKP